MPSAPVTCVFIGLGSNLGDRPGFLRQAVRRLSAQSESCLTGVSPLYASPAHTLRPEESQPEFINAVARVCTTLAPDQLLELLHTIEREAGRDRTLPAWSPRTLDLDLLAYGDHTLTSDNLVIPHPRLAGRRFVLEPWSALAPDFWVPAPYGATVAELLARCEDPGKLTLLEDTWLDSSAGRR